MTVGSTATPVTEPSSAEAESSAVVLPSKRDEAWRYAPHGELARLKFGPAPGSVIDVPAAVEEQIPQLDGPRVVIVNGVVDQTRSDMSDLPPGVQISALAAAGDQLPSTVAAATGSGSDGPLDAFTKLNMAFGGDGAFVDIGSGLKLDTPIHIVDIAIPGQTQNGSCTGVVVHLDDHSSATVVETRIGGGQQFGGSNVRSTITLGAGASLHHILLQDLPPNQIHLGRLDVHQGPDSEFRAHSFNLGASYGRLTYHVRLAAERAHVDLTGLYFGFGEQTLDQQITVVHDAKDCTSRQSFRGVLDDSSTGVFNGGIAVSPGADGTDAEQANDNLLLSTQAEANSQPRLEILADDVACKHGATVGQLDDSALYYLRSRGIPLNAARMLLIKGFADQTIEDLPIDALKTWIAQRLGPDLGNDNA